jgi:hypothetical protein
MNPDRSDRKQSPDRVSQALDIYRSIVACHAYSARRDDVHALTAGLMLPCYEAEFERLTVGLSDAEEHALRSALQRIRDAGLAVQD